MSSMTDGILDFLHRQVPVQAPRWPQTETHLPSECAKRLTVAVEPPGRLANRVAFERLMVQYINEGKPVALLLLDLDGLNRVNELHGFEVGDALLTAFGELLYRIMPLGSTVTHLFSDEFAILIPGVYAAEEADVIAMRIGSAIEVPFDLGGHVIGVTASIGTVHSPQVGNIAGDVLPAASRALRQAKADGGGWRAFKPSMLDHSDELRDDLAFALTHQEIIPFYQPIVELDSGRIVGLEVLARWNHPRLGLLLPELFIKPMEKMGILNGLTTSLLHQVAEDAVHWPADWVFSFNVAPTQIRELATYILMQPKPPRITLPPCRIEIEISEMALIDDVEATHHLVDLLQQKGARVALDNFGGDRANIRHICGIPFNRLKISRSFMADIMHDARAGICVRSIADVGRQLSIDVTAEGIPSQEVADRVMALGCRFGQGSFFAMPVPADEIAGLAAHPPWMPA